MASLSQTNQTWAIAAPVLALDGRAIDARAQRIAPIRSRGTTPGKPVALLSMQATSQGLSVRQMEGFDNEEARAGLRRAGWIRSYRGDGDRLRRRSGRAGP